MPGSTSTPSTPPVCGEPTTLATREVYRNNWMVVTESDLQRPDGSPGLYGVVHKPTGVVVVAWRESEADPAGEVLMVEQYRYALGRRCWEFVAGTAPDLAEQEPAELAQRELREETGYRAADVHHMGWIDVAPGFVEQIQHVFLMQNLTAGKAEQEDTEADIRWRWWPVAELKTAFRYSRITDAQALAAWALVEPHLEF